jgi:TonB family protein
MKLLFIWSFILLSNSLLAQKSTHKDTIIKADTINLRGVVYDYEGKPVKNIDLLTQQHNYRLYATKTDSNGYFEVKGADPNGGLRLLDARYYNTYFPFKGSRYMIIYLPQAFVINITRDSIILKAMRKRPKVVPSIKEELPEPDALGCFDCGPGNPPIYPTSANYPQFINSLKNDLIYPQKALDNNIEGLVEIEFIVERGGVPTRFKVLKGIGYGCDEEVIELIKKSKWHTGIYNGRFIATPLKVSVKFELTDK